VDLDFAFICDYAEVTNKINALGVGFDRIYAPKLPARHPHFHLVAQLRFRSTEIGSKNMSVHLIDADGNAVVPPIKGNFEVRKPPPRLLHALGRINVGFGNVEFKKYGDYSISLVVQGTEVTSIPFAVTEPPTTG